MDKRLVVIVGPTAVGKTATAIRVAQALRTEIVSADSRQIFRELTIGTAKPTSAELAAVRHHFIDTHAITEDYDAARYGDEALAVIHRLMQTHADVVLCGGSGLYVQAVCEGFDDIPPVPDEVRAGLMAGYASGGLAWLQAQMREHDPAHLQAVDVQNPHRLIRVLEVKLGTGRSIASFRKQARREHPFSIVKIGLELPREVLYERIDARMDAMIAAGLFEEARALYPHRHRQALQTVGYRELFDYMDGLYDREEAIRLLKRNSRRYAKRQLTWFKRDESIRWASSWEEVAAIVGL